MSLTDAELHFDADHRFMCYLATVQFSNRCGNDMLMRGFSGMMAMDIVAGTGRKSYKGVRVLSHARDSFEKMEGARRERAKD